MREIQFRGKRLDNGEWVEGYLVKRPTAVCIGDYSPWYIEVPPKDPDDKHGSFNVDPATIGQYTGLDDKDGKRIFEGDLLNGFQYPFLRAGENIYNYFAEVVWFDNSPAFGLVTHKYPLSAVRGISDGNAEYMEDFDPNDWEVIGNIHDNPELLEGGADG